MGSLRLRLTLLFAGLAAVAIVALAWFTVQTRRLAVDDEAIRHGRDVIAEVVVRWERDGRPDDGEPSDTDWPNNTWLVGVSDVADDRYTQALGPVWVEPPLYGVAEAAVEFDVASTRYQQDGTDYLVYGVRLAGEEALITVIDVAPIVDDNDALRWRIGLAAAAAIGGVVVAGWFVSGRALRPIRSANARQRDFIADAAHEMRTPLAVIRASATHALSKPRSDEEYVAALGEIDSAASSANAAVSELLELARIDSGQFSPRLAPLRLDLLAEEVVAGVRVEGSELTIDAPRPVTVEADYALLHHAVENVVRNAAARAAHVVVSVRAEGKAAVIEVADDGPGFPAELLADVFDRFRRGDSRGSSGLGLAISRSIVQAHRGRATAANRPDGAGAIVTVTLPYRGEQPR